MSRLPEGGSQDKTVNTKIPTSSIALIVERSAPYVLDLSREYGEHILMQLGMWDTLFNILLFIFWFRIWNEEERDVTFNPYLAPMGRASDTAVNFLRPVFFTIPPRLIAAIVLVFLIVFRSLGFRAMAESRGLSWVLRLGFDKSVVTPGILSWLVFSFESFAVFLFKIWGFSLLYLHSRRDSFVSHTTGAIHYAARPFTDFKVELRPLILLAYGIVLIFLLNMTGQKTFGLAPWDLATPPVLLIRFAISALAGWVSILSIVLSVMVILIIGSWVSMFTGSHSVMFFCKDWMDLILGPLRRYPLRIGMIDLSPLIFFFGIRYLVFPLLIRILLASYNALG